MIRPILLNIDSNAKTIKGQKRGYMTAILYLAPSAVSGVNLCPMAALAGCIAGCLNQAGHGGMSKGNATFNPYGMDIADNNVQRCRIARARFFIEDRDGFMFQLAGEIARFIRKANKAKLIPVVRLNGTSDIPWENIPIGSFRNIFALFAGVQFYDYTKMPSRNVASISNYHLSFSWSGVAGWSAVGAKALARGLNPVVVFRTANFPQSYMGRPVISGDDSDLRFTDPAGVVVALKAKGKAKGDTSGFVIDAIAA